MKPVLIFDYDGTINETMKIYMPGVRKAVDWLIEDCGIEVEKPSDERIAGWLGVNMDDMWADFMPGLDADIKHQAERLVGKVMLEKTMSHEAAWYAGMEETLDELKRRGYDMAVLSNCGILYAKTQWEVFHMDRWFDAFFQCESFDNAPKEVIMAAIAADYEKAAEMTPVKSERGCKGHLRDFIGIGDRDSDLAAAQSIGAPFIGCVYGYASYGELDDADISAGSPENILTATAILDR
ncbi:MAG: HAD family hydrolase [Firmicutes bacterium]|nr:HAD family hydrolase [Bacillota bacterium]